jgi:hypothetical protein
MEVFNTLVQAKKARDLFSGTIKALIDNIVPAE